VLFGYFIVIRATLAIRIFMVIRIVPVLMALGLLRLLGLVGRQSDASSCYYFRVTFYTRCDRDSMV
jgi:hypothetical protein